MILKVTHNNARQMEKPKLDNFFEIRTEDCHQQPQQIRIFFFFSFLFLLKFFRICLRIKCILEKFFFLFTEIMNKAILIAALAVMLPLVWSQCFSRNDTEQISADRLYYGQRKFSVSFLDALQKARPNESLFFSPHSTYRALLLAYFGAKSETEQSLKKTLQLDWANSKADVSHAYELEKLARVNRVQHQTVEFNSVDKLYFSKQVEIK